MRDLTIGVFEHLATTPPMDVDKRVDYIQRTLRGYNLKKYKAVLEECKKTVKDLAGDKWELGALNGISTDDFWDWAKKDGIGYVGDSYLGLDECVDFDKEIWLELGKCMWRKHRSIYQDHLKYVRNDTVKNSRVRILCYAKRVTEMHDLMNTSLHLRQRARAMRQLIGKWATNN